MKDMENEDFVPVSDDYGNELGIYADDFNELANKPRGTEAVFLVRCAIKSHRGAIGMCVANGEKPRAKIELFVWDAKLVSCEDTKEDKLDMSKIEKALGGSGRQVDGKPQDTFYAKDGE